jgi:hypothetical protein
MHECRAPKNYDVLLIGPCPVGARELGRKQTELAPQFQIAHAHRVPCAYALLLRLPHTNKPLTAQRDYLICVELARGFWEVGLPHPRVHDEALDTGAQKVLAHQAALRRLALAASMCPAHHTRLEVAAAQSMGLKPTIWT